MENHPEESGNAASTSLSSPSLSAVTHKEEAEEKKPPFLRVVRGVYGAGTVLADVTLQLQELVDQHGGLSLAGFGYKGLKPNGSMNALFGDPIPGRDKQLLVSYEIVGCRLHLITVPEDKKLKLKMKHIYEKVMGSPAPEEARLISVEIVKATYGCGNDVFDVTSSLRIMLAEQGGRGLEAFGYTIKPNGCMNRAFGDPCPGKDKTLAIEYRWRTPVLTHAVDEDQRLSLCFEKLRPLL